MVDDSSDETSPCDELENGTLDLPNVSDELNAVAEIFLFLTMSGIV